MPKLKTNKGAAKRFKKTKNGKFKRYNAYGRHLLTKKSAKRKRNLRSPEMLDAADEKCISRLLPYA